MHSAVLHICHDGNMLRLAVPLFVCLRVWTWPDVGVVAELKHGLLRLLACIRALNMQIAEVSMAVDVLRAVEAILRSCICSSGWWQQLLERLGTGHVHCTRRASSPSISLADVVLLVTAFVKQGPFSPQHGAAALSSDQLGELLLSFDDKHMFDICLHRTV